MSKTNGQTNIQEPPQNKEREPELPAADPGDGFVEKSFAAQSPAQAPPETELQKLRLERDNLFDRLARLQAEFDNYRKRAAKENADFRDYTLADAAKSLLSVIDKSSLSLKNAGNVEEFKPGIELVNKQLKNLRFKL